MIPIKIPWTSQPPAGTPIAAKYRKNVIAAWVFDEQRILNDRSGNHFHATEGTSAGTVFTAGTSMLADANKWGKGKDFGGTNQAYEISSALPSDSRLQKPCSFLWAGAWDDSGDGSQRIIDKSSAGDAASGWAISLNPSNNRLEVYRNGAPTTHYFNATANALAAGPAAFVVTTPPDGVTGKAKLWVNGQSLPGDIADTDFSTFSTTSTRARIGTWNHSTGREFNGTMNILVLFDNELSSDEAVKLSTNPYLVFEPRTIYVPYTAAAATTPGLLPVKYGSNTTLGVDRFFGDTFPMNDQRATLQRVRVKDPGWMNQASAWFGTGSTAGTSARVIVYTSLRADPGHLVGFSNLRAVPAGGGRVDFGPIQGFLEGGRDYYIGIVCNNFTATIVEEASLSGVRMVRLEGVNVGRPQTLAPAVASEYTAVRLSVAVTTTPRTIWVPYEIPAAGNALIPVKVPWASQPPLNVDLNESHGFKPIFSVVPGQYQVRGSTNVGDGFVLSKGADQRQFDLAILNASSASITPRPVNYKGGAARSVQNNPFDHASGYALRNTDNDLFINRPSFTLVGIFRPNGAGDAGGSGDPRIFSKDLGSGADDHDVMIGGLRAFDAPECRARIRIGSSTLTVVTSGNEWQTDAWNLIAVTVTPSGANTNVRVIGIREDGTLYSNTGSQAGTYNPRTTTDIALFSNGVSNQNMFDGEILCVTMFDGVLSDGNLRKFFANPWQIFEPRNIWIPVQGAAASPPVEPPGAATVALLLHNIDDGWMPHPVSKLRGWLQ